MLVKNTFTHDARVEKEAVALIEAGHNVTVIAVSNGEQPRAETRSGITIVRVARGPGNSLRKRNDTSGSGDLARQRRPMLSVVLRRIGASPVGDFVHWLTDRRMVAASDTVPVEVVHAHDLDCLAAGVAIASRRGVPLIYDTHEMATGRNLASAHRQRLARRREGRLIKHVTQVISAAPGYTQRITDFYGQRPGAVVLNASPLHDLHRCNHDLRTALGFPDEAFVVVHQGVLLPNRGIDQGIEAMATLDDGYLAIIGYGPHRAALEILVRDLQVTDRVRFLGAVPANELICWSASADAALCTIVGTSDSYRHSMPNKLFEYIMAEVPIIASHYPGMGSLVAENGFGLTCDPESVDDIADCISQLMADQDLRARIRENLAARRADFAWPTQAQKLLQVYDAL